MTAWPQIKTAQALVLEKIIPCSEDTLKALAKTYGIGRKLGRAYVFTPDDVVALVEKLPCPSNSSKADTAPPTGISGALSAESASTKALAFATKPRPKICSSRGRRNSSTSPSTVTPFPVASRKPR